MKTVVIPDESVKGVNIVPVIDVTLVLLVILLLMSPVLNLPNLPVQLPEAMTKETKDLNITVSLGADGRISVDKNIIPASRLFYALKTALMNKEGAVVIIRADRRLAYGQVETLIREVNRCVGNHSIAVATQQRTSPLQVKK